MIAFFVDGPLMGREVILPPDTREYLVDLNIQIDASGPNEHLLAREPVNLSTRTATYHLHLRHEQNGEVLGIFALDMQGFQMALLLWQGVLATLNASVQKYVEVRG